MFWNLILEPGKKYTSTVKESFHLSMATLDVQPGIKDNEIFPVQLEINGQKSLLCNLAKPHYLHANLDLNFQKGTELTFSTNGKATIHLTGYLVIDELEEELTDSSELEEESEDENPLFKTNKSITKNEANTKKQGDGDFSLKKLKNMLNNSSSEKRKLNTAENKVKKKAKHDKDDLSENEKENNSNDESDDSTLDKLDMNFSDDDDNDDDDDDDEDDDDEDVDESDENEDDESDELSLSDSEDKEDNSSKHDKTNKKMQTSNLNEKTPVVNKKFQNKIPTNAKKQDGKQEKTPNKNIVNGATPATQKKKAKNNTPKSEIKTPKNNASLGSPQSQKKQTVEGGVTVEDLKMGNGPVAKPGRMVTVYYVGRLKNNNRVFDQVNSGAGFKFRLGRNEVIKGWDVGLNGMKVGSKRRITCPPAMAYGNKSMPPSIPANSTLIFDVELRSVN
ncbi:hypothetical protein PGB90_006937 [Kerria lacca]